jgi:hypothetical protein
MSGGPPLRATEGALAATSSKVRVRAFLIINDVPPHVWREVGRTMPNFSGRLAFIVRPAVVLAMAAGLTSVVVINATPAAAATDLEWSGCVGFEGQSGVGEEAVE